MFGNILVTQQVEFAILDRLEKVANTRKEATEDIRRHEHLTNEQFGTEDEKQSYIKLSVSNACYDAERLLVALQKIRGL